MDRPEDHQGEPDGRFRARTRPPRTPSRWTWPTSGPSSRPGTSCSRDRCRRWPRTAPPARPWWRWRPSSTSWPTWASTWSTSRPSIPSARRTARVRTTPRWPARPIPGSPWAIGGPDGRPRRHPSRPGRSGRLQGPGVGRVGAPDGGGAWTWPSSAHPITPGSPSIPTGSATVPTARSSTPRTRPSGTRTSTRSTSRPRRGASCGTRWPRSPGSGASRGSRVFRVDNPHTKPYPFWEWLIAEIRRRHPGTIFLAEAFSRPAVMHRLAQIGFTQSYTYFTWRSRRFELREYLTELSTPPSVDELRPNLWPTTPDILPGHLQHAPLEAFAVRLVLAATLSPSYGVLRPELRAGGEPSRRADGREELADSEKYQIRTWDLSGARTLRPLMGHLNQHPSGSPGPAHVAHAALPRHRQRRRPLLLQDRPRRSVGRPPPARGGHRGGGGQPRSRTSPRRPR